MNKNTEGKKNKKENKADVLINSTFAIIIFIYKKSW